MWGAFNPRHLLAWLGSARSTVRWSGLGFVAVGVLIAVLALPKSQPKARSAALDEVVLAADQALGTAMRSGDRASARRLLTLQFSYVDADGKIHPRREFLGGLTNVAARPATDVKIRNFGSLAMMTGKHASAQAPMFSSSMSGSGKRAPGGRC